MTFCLHSSNAFKASFFKFCILEVASSLTNCSLSFLSRSSAVTSAVPGSMSALMSFSSSLMFSRRSALLSPAVGSKLSSMSLRIDWVALARRSVKSARCDSSNMVVRSSPSLPFSSCSSAGTCLLDWSEDGLEDCLGSNFGGRLEDCLAASLGGCLGGC